MAINTYLSIITLNVNGLNAPIKRHRVADCRVLFSNPICCLEETHFRAKDTHRLKVRGWKEVFPGNGNEKKAGVAILISDKLDLKTKAIKKDKEQHYTMIKGSIKKRILHLSTYMHLI